MSSITTKTTNATQTSLSNGLASIHGDQCLSIPLLGQFKACCLMLGFFVGTFIYLSSLGAEFLAAMLWGKDVLARTNLVSMVLSLAWNLATICIAFVILTCLRHLVASVFLDAMRHSQFKKNAEAILDHLLLYLECHFGVGALVGICVTWNATNLALGGKRPQVTQPCIIMAAACLWCRVMLMLLVPQEDSLIRDGSNSEEQNVVQQPKGYSYVSKQDDDDKTSPL